MDVLISTVQVRECVSIYRYIDIYMETWCGYVHGYRVHDTVTIGGGGKRDDNKNKITKKKRRAGSRLPSSNGLAA